MYRELGQLTKDKTIWKQNIPYVASLLKNQSPKITAKAMWLLGEMGLIYPQEIAPYTKEIASFIVSENDLLRERTANALGRIGRADYKLISPYFKELFTLAGDKSSNVRLSFKGHGDGEFVSDKGTHITEQKPLLRQFVFPLYFPPEQLTYHAKPRGRGAGPRPLALWLAPAAFRVFGSRYGPGLQPGP